MTCFIRRFLAAILITSGLFILSTMSAYAQDSYVWEDYNIGFSVASDLIVTENDAESFSGVTSDGEITISISPWLDEMVNEDNLADAALEMAIDLYLFDDSEVDGDFFEVDTFTGVYLIAAPGIADAPDYMIVALMLDTESDTNIAVAIGFAEGNEDEAVEILESFFSY